MVTGTKPKGGTVALSTQVTNRFFPVCLSKILDNNTLLSKNAEKIKKAPRKVKILVAIYHKFATSKKECDPKKDVIQKRT